MEADQKRAVARVIRVGRLPIVALAAAFLMVGCGGSTEPEESSGGGLAVAGPAT